jgi:hypothetical protein
MELVEWGLAPRQAKPSVPAPISEIADADTRQAA